MAKSSNQRLKPHISAEAYASKLGLRGQTLEGAEIPSPVPMAPPLGYKRQPTMVEHIRDMVRSEQLRQVVAAQGMETFEESDDFDVPDDIFPASPHEVGDLEPLSAVKAREVAAREAAEAAAAAAEAAEAEELEPPSPRAPKAPKKPVEAED